MGRSGRQYSFFKATNYKSGSLIHLLTIEWSLASIGTCVSDYWITALHCLIRHLYDSRTIKEAPTAGRSSCAQQGAASGCSTMMIVVVRWAAAGCGPAGSIVLLGRSLVAPQTLICSSSNSLKGANFRQFNKKQTVVIKAGLYLQKPNNWEGTIWNVYAI